MQKNKIGPISYTIHKNNSKWIKDLNIIPETTKLLKEKKIGEKLLDISLGYNFLYMTSKIETTKAKINKWDCIKLRCFCTAKETINKIKSEKYLQTIYLIMSKICKQLVQLNSRKTTQFKKWTEELNKHFSKEDIQVANR